MKIGGSPAPLRMMLRFAFSRTALCAAQRAGLRQRSVDVLCC